MYHLLVHWFSLYHDIYNLQSTKPQIFAVWFYRKMFVDSCCITQPKTSRQNVILVKMWVLKAVFSAQIPALLPNNEIFKY